MNLIPLLNNSIVEVNATKEQYHVHYLQVSGNYEFKHIKQHKSGMLNNMSKDKIKEANGPNGVINLLHCNIIRIVQPQSLQFEKIFEINL